MQSGILSVRKENVINLGEMMRVSSEDFRYVKCTLKAVGSGHLQLSKGNRENVVNKSFGRKYLPETRGFQT